MKKLLLIVYVLVLQGCDNNQYAEQEKDLETADIRGRALFAGSADWAQVPQAARAFVSGDDCR